jgi:hypothetical protein
LLVTLAFSIGAAVPLLFVALAGGALVERARSLRQKGPMLRRIGGVVLIVMAIAISQPLQLIPDRRPGLHQRPPTAHRRLVHGASRPQVALGTVSTDGSLALVHAQ